MKRNFLILVCFLLIVSIFQIGTVSSAEVNVSFEIKDIDGNPIQNTLVIIQGISDTSFSQNKLTDSNGEVTFSLNENEVFVYIIDKESYKEQTENFSTDSGKNFGITLEKLEGNEWNFYSISNEDLEFRFDSLDDDTIYSPGDYIKKVFELRNLGSKNIELVEGESLFQIVDGETLNLLRAWGNLNPQGQELIGITLKEGGSITTTIVEENLEVCLEKVIIVSQEIGTIEGDVCFDFLQNVNKIPPWILDEEYRFKIHYEYIIDGEEKSLDFTSQEFSINNDEWKPDLISSPETDLSVDEEWKYEIKLRTYNESYYPILSAINYKLIEFPDGMKIDANEGNLSWTPSQAGDYDVTVRVYHQYFQNDPSKIAFRDQNFTLHVTGDEPANNPPQITSAPVTEVNETENYVYDVDASDADGDTITYSLTQAPSWLSIDSSTGEITGTAQNVSSDTNYNIEVSVSDGQDADTQSYTLTVKDISETTNNAPVITSTPITEVNETELYEYQVIATDADNDSLTYSLTESPDWLSIDSSIGLISGTAPDITSDTNYGITVSVTDGINSITQVYTLNVEFINKLPMITSDPITQINEGQEYSYHIEANDPDENDLSFSLNEAPNWISIDSNGLVTGSAPIVPNDTDYTIEISVSDGISSTNQTYILTVKEISMPPIAFDKNISITSSSISTNLPAEDPEGDDLTFFITQSPSKGKIYDFNPSEGTITYVPDENFSGKDTLKFRVSDGTEYSNIATLTIFSNDLPQIISSPLTNIPEGSTYNYQIIANDSDGDTLAYSLTESPDWLNINSVTGEITGNAPIVSKDEFFNIVIEVSDQRGGIVNQNYNLNVRNIIEVDDDDGGSNGGGVIRINDEFYEHKYLTQELGQQTNPIQNVISSNDNSEELLNPEENSIEKISSNPLVIVLFILNLVIIFIILLLTSLIMNTGTSKIYSK